jgi:hypothetical protein
MYVCMYKCVYLPLSLTNTHTHSHTFARLFFVSLVLLYPRCGVRRDVKPLDIMTSVFQTAPRRMSAPHSSILVRFVCVCVCCVCVCVK